MSQADSINTTSRRGFLTRGAAMVAGGGAILSTPVFGAPTKPLDASAASPALHDAVVALRESHDRLEAAKARFTADDSKVEEWRANNPEPAGKRAKEVLAQMAGDAGRHGNGKLARSTRCGKGL
jgi:hypothetical protein